MKRMMLIFLLFLSSSTMHSSIFEVHNLYTYKNIPSWYYRNSFWLKTVVISLSKWLNYMVDDRTPYSIEYINSNDGVSAFVTYNRQWMICVRFNEKLHECQVELFGDNNNFSHLRFKAIADFYFRYT